MSEKAKVLGGSFLVQTTNPEDMFTPEDFTSEQLMYAKTANDFTENEVVPVTDRLEAKEEGLNEKLMEKAGELGLLMADIPEEYDGMGLDKASIALITEKITAKGGSFAVTYGAQTGIGTLPIVYYGTEAQKKKYLPLIASGEKKAAYCLTEPSSGSDSLSARSKAILSDDGKYYTITGTKQFITNGGFAEILFMFAKVDGEHFTAFIMDKEMEGLSSGPEEHKLGIRGSSTTTILMDEVKVPVENLLGEIGKGHKIAFNILNIGRYKLGIGAVGVCKVAIGEALAYALERKQFGKRIAEFGMIREKLADMYVKTYAAESMGYRTVGMIDAMVEASNHSIDSLLKSIEEFSIECAMVKVFGSEVHDFVVDENLQIHGGYGYCAEYNAERYYRDARINRIFEGTSEVNRLLIPAMLLRKGMKGELPLFQAAKALAEELMEIPDLDMDSELEILGAETQIVENLKKICIFVAGSAAQKFGPKFAEEQELLARTADLTMLAYTAESTVVRAKKLLDAKGEQAAALPIAAAQVTCENAMANAEALAREAITALAEGDVMMTMLAGLRRLSRRTSADTIKLKKMIGDKMIEDERVPFAL